MPPIPKKKQGMTLHKNHAIVHTASIDVKILRLDKRQMTLSVFRQIQEKCVFDQQCSMLGVSWGTVNYLWERSPAWADYYIIWQDGPVLYRCPLPLIARIWDEIEMPSSRQRVCVKCEMPQDYYCGCSVSRSGKKWKFINYREKIDKSYPFCNWIEDCNEIRKDSINLDDCSEGTVGRRLINNLECCEKLDQLFIAV